MFTAKYSDGKTAKLHRVAVFFQSKQLVISGGNVLETWSYAEISKMEKSKSILGIFKGKQLPLESLFFDDLSAFEKLKIVANGEPFLSESHDKFDQKGLKAYLLGVLGILVVLAGIHFFLIPALVTAIASAFPEDLEQKMGDRYFEILEQTEIINRERTELLQSIADLVDFQTSYPLKFHVIESEMVNAFALPGGKIVVFTGLLDQMTSVDQLVALLGHEVGHVELRHSLKSIFREQSYAIVFSSISGGNNQILDAVVGFTGTLNSLHSSREAEQEADYFGLNVLYQNGLNPNGAVELFELLEKQGSMRIPEVLSTHAASENRAQELKNRIVLLGPNNEKEHFEIVRIFKKLVPQKEGSAGH